MANQEKLLTAKSLRAALGISRQRAHYWARNGVPPVHVPAVSEALGIPKHEIRPDLWEAPKSRKRKEKSL